MIPDLPPHNPIQEAIPQLSESAAMRAQSALLCARAAGQKVEKFMIIDASRNANEKRLFVLDVRKEPHLLLSDWVAHGSGSDKNRDGQADRFSNAPNSNATSLGLYRVSEPFRGNHPGWSYRLDGMTPGFNDNARARSVVIHSSTYVTPGHVGRSWGCPAVRPEVLERFNERGLQDTLLWIDAEGQGLDAVAESCQAAKQFVAQLKDQQDPYSQGYSMSPVAAWNSNAMICQA